MPDKQTVIPANEPDRLKALKNYEILNSLSEQEFDRITELASLICATPISLVTLLDESRQWFKSKVGLDINETPRDIAFCQYTIMQDALFEVRDALQDERFKDNELVTGSPDIRFYAGFPLKDPAGYNLGTICVIDRKPRILDEWQKRALELLSREVTGLIVERRQKEELRNFESLFKLSPDLICIAGTDGYFKKVNPALQHLLGLPLQELLNTSFYELIHPDDMETTRQELLHVESGEKVLNFTMRISSAGRGYRHVQWSASPENGTGNLFAVGRDLTVELATEGQLADSEAKLRAFFENSQGLMCTHDLEGKFISVNTAGALMLGYGSGELLAKTLFDLIPEREHPGLRNYLEQIRKTGAGKGLVTMRHKDGGLKTWIFNNVMEKTAAGELYIIANALDITDRYELEVNLQRANRMLEETNQVARIGGWQIDVEQQKLYWTPVTKEIHGVRPNYEPDVKAGINFYKEGESRNSISLAVEKALKDGSPWNLEVQIINATGRELWVRAIGKAEMKEGVCKRLYGTLHDIDEKKKAQIEINRSRAILSAFVQHAPAAVAMLDRSMHYVAASNCWLEDYSLKDKGVIGASYYDHFNSMTPESRHRHQRILRGAVERNPEDTFLFPDESNGRYTTWEMRPWYELDGKVGGMMIFTQDVTHMVEKRELLKAAKIQADAANVAKSEFLANMSHNITKTLAIVGNCVFN